MQKYNFCHIKVLSFFDSDEINFLPWESSNNSRIKLDKAFISFTLKSFPFRLFSIISLLPEQSLAIHGKPEAIASNSAFGKPSYKDGKTNKSASLRYFSIFF